MKLNKIVFIFIIFSINNHLRTQKLSLRLGLSNSYWGVSKFFWDTAKLSKLTNSQEKIFDYNFGIIYARKYNKFQIDAKILYELNSIKSIALNFNTDGELIRLTNLHFLGTQFQIARVFELKHRCLIVGLGLDLDFRIFNKWTEKNARLIYIPSRRYNSDFARDVNFKMVTKEFPLQKQILFPGFHFESKYEIGELGKHKVYLFSNISMSLKPILNYNWRFLNEGFAYFRGYRICGRIGCDISIF